MTDQEGTERLERLWEAYRQATPEPEPSVNFTPELWGRIEAARPASWAVPLARLASRLLPLAAAVTLVMGAFVRSQYAAPPNVATTGYVDVLVADMLEEQQPAFMAGDGGLSR